MNVRINNEVFSIKKKIFAVNSLVRILYLSAPQFGLATFQVVSRYM